jgi:hypothetical protein
MMGYIRTPEHRAAIAAANRARVVSPETRAKMSAAKLGKPLTPDHRAKLSSAHVGLQNALGFRHTAATRAKMSARMQGNQYALQDVVRYAAAHRRLIVARGPARDHLCVDCGSAATEWALRHNTPASRVLRSDRGKSPYSLDLGDYDPRCTACHRTYDLGKSKDESP